MVKQVLPAAIHFSGMRQITIRGHRLLGNSTVKYDQFVVSDWKTPKAFEWFYFNRTQTQYPLTVHDAAYVKRLVQSDETLVVDAEMATMQNSGSEVLETEGSWRDLETPSSLREPRATSLLAAVRSRHQHVSPKRHQNAEKRITFTSAGSRPRRLPLRDSRQTRAPAPSSRRRA